MRNDLRPSLLVVDDNAKNLHAIQRMLEVLDIQVHTVLSGNEALKAILSQDFFLILMDVQMPGMNGFETAELIRGHAHYKSIPIIFVTATRKEPEYIEAGYDYGAVDYLYKPLNARVLTSKVKVFLALHLTCLAAEQAQRVAEAENKAKSAFLANMSHELRSPLNAILILSKLMSENASLPEQEKANAQIIYTNGEGLLTLVDDLLDMAKVEAGKLTLEIEPMSLHSMVDNLMLQLKPVADKKHIVFEANFADSTPDLIQSDELRLSQVMRNLLSNAFKFTPKNGRVTIDTRVLERDCVISVTDTGEGIPEDKIEHIFEAFNQADNSITRRHGGTGLGLKITQALTTLMGGRVTVTSELGKGSCFRLHLPCLADNQAGVTSVVAKATATQQAVLLDRPFAGVTVLVVEDELVNCLVLGQVLELHGCTVLSAHDGVLGLAKLREHPEVQMVFTDIMMPNMDGHEFILCVRAETQWQSLPIVATTARAMEEDVQACYASGANAFISKPIIIGDLVKTISQLL